jgi:hypothetical protein
MVTACVPAHNLGDERISRKHHSSPLYILNPRLGILYYTGNTEYISPHRAITLDQHAGSVEGRAVRID